MVVLSIEVPRPILRRQKRWSDQEGGNEKEVIIFLSNRLRDLRECREVLQRGLVRSPGQKQVLVCFEGGAENDGPENEGPSKCPGMNLTDMK